MGRQIGFPTANLDVLRLVLPPSGVYAVHALVRGRSYRAVANIGVRPTLQEPDPQVHVEAYLLDFNDELYGEELEIRFVEKLRGEKKFGSMTELKEQITRDIEWAKNCF